MNKFLAKLLHNVASREFQVFVVACVFLPLSFIDMGTWKIIALAYIGFRSVQKMRNITVTDIFNEEPKPNQPQPDQPE